MSYRPYRFSITAFLITVALLTVLLAACGLQTADGGRQTADGGPQTAIYETPVYPTPTPTHTSTPTATPTPLPHPAAFDPAFAGGLVRFDAASGQWRVTAVQTADGGRQTVDDGRQTADFTLLPNTFSTHDDLRAHNPLAPYTVRAVDENNQEVTLIWNPDTAEFRLAYQFPALFEGVGTENPRLIEENLDAIPFIPIEDIQSGLAAQSVLLAMQESGYQPFSENTRLGENRLHFELRNNGLRTADLTSLGNLDRSINVNNHQTKVTPSGLSLMRV